MAFGLITFPIPANADLSSATGRVMGFILGFGVERKKPMRRLRTHGLRAWVWGACVNLHKQKWSG